MTIPDVLSLIEKGKIESALKKSLELTRATHIDHYRNLIILSGRHHQIIEKEINGRITTEDLPEKNGIAKALIDILFEISDEVLELETLKKENQELSASVTRLQIQYRITKQENEQLKDMAIKSDNHLFKLETRLLEFKEKINALEKEKFELINEIKSLKK